MINQEKKCSSKEHPEMKAIIYCQECKIYICNKCEKFHSNFFQNHHTHNLEKNIDEIFTGLCKIEKHSLELKFFCKNHNQLCCAACLSKIKNIEFGQHKDCSVCEIQEIKEEKECNLKENIKYLEEISTTLDQSINELKKIYDQMNINKEKLKEKIQKIFTRLRCALDKREDELLFEIDEKYKNFYFGEEIIKQSEKLPKQVKIYLEKGKNLVNNWNKENELNININDSINIENNILTINKINENINKCNNTLMGINFEPDEKGIDEFMSKIKDFGNINTINFNKNIISKCFTNIIAFCIGGNIPIDSNNILNEEIKKYYMPKKEEIQEPEEKPKNEWKKEGKKKGKKDKGKKH